MPTSFPLATARLLIAPLTEADAAAFAAYRSDPEVARWQSWAAPHPLARARAALAANPQDWPARGAWAQLGIRAAGRLVGDVAVHPLDDPVQPDAVEVGVTLEAAAQGRGIATEAMTAVIGALFERGAHRVVAATDARNTPVARLLARVGLRHEGRAVEAEWWKGEWTTVDAWALLAADRR